MISGELALLFCGIALAISMGVAVATLIVLNNSIEKKADHEKNLLTALESLTKLAAAKDVQAYQALQAGTTFQKAPELEVIEPMDDESVARRMMGLYSERGIDPALALSGDEDPLEDFGGTSAFFGAKE